MSNLDDFGSDLNLAHYGCCSSLLLVLLLAD